MKKIVIINTTMRKNGNSEILAKSFADGAIAKGNEIKTISVRDLNLKFCLGCLHCQDKQKCILSDGMNDIYATIQEAEVIVFSTPIYFYSVCGQLKTFIDRLNPLFTRENNFKEIYLLAAAADSELSAIDGAVTAIKGFVDCFEGVEYKGALLASEVTAVGDISDSAFLKQAYQMGFNI